MPVLPQAVFGSNGVPCAGGTLIVERNLRPDKIRCGRGKPTGLRGPL